MNDLAINEKDYELANIPELEVKNQLSYERVIEFRNIAVEKKRLISETFDPIVEKAFASHRQATATRAKFLEPVLRVIAIIDGNVKTYKRECERKTQEEQDRLRREAEEKARKEKERLEARAEKWQEKGNNAKADELLEKAEQVEAIVPTVAPSIIKVKGDTTRKLWRAKVVNFKSLPDMYKVANESLLNSIARNTKGSQKIEGVEFYCE